MLLLRPLALAALLAVAPALPAQVFTTPLTGAAEIPPNASPGSGNVFLSFSNPILSISANFTGLTGTTTMAHIHCCSSTMNVGVATQVPNFATFPLGVTQGTHVQQLDLDQTASWNSAFITSSGGTVALAKARLLERMALGEAYYNVHTSTFGGGEIRGLLVLDSMLIDGFE